MRECGCAVELARVGVAKPARSGLQVELARVDTVKLVRLGLQVGLVRVSVAKFARIITLLQKLPARFPEGNCTSGGNVKRINLMCHRDTHGIVAGDDGLCG